LGSVIEFLGKTFILVSFCVFMELEDFVKNVALTALFAGGMALATYDAFFSKDVRRSVARINCERVIDEVDGEDNVLSEIEGRRLATDLGMQLPADFNEWHLLKISTDYEFGKIYYGVGNKKLGQLEYSNVNDYVERLGMPSVWSWNR
jgi:hypothetical protein